MSFFSRTTNAEKPTAQSVPQDIRNAVNVMSKASSQDEKATPRPVSPFQGASPFLSSAPEKKKAPVVKEPAPVEKKEVIPQEAKPSFSFERKKMTIFALIGLGVLIIGVLVWYFLKDTPKELAPSEEVVIPDTVLPPAETSVAFLPFVPDAPNYLSLDIETVTAQSLSVIVSGAGAKIVEASMKQPVEFLLTDKNNNPLAFSRFAYLMNIDFSEETLASFGESFSLFLYNDAGIVKTGLVLTFADPSKSENVIKTKERSLPFSFRTVLFQDFAVPREVVFRSGIYKEQAVRFVNIDTAKNISFDYAFYKDRLFIGTSKDTLRAILDKQQK